MANNRIIYPAEQVGFAKIGSNTFIAAHGVQSLGMNVSLPREAISELGQSKVYQNIEGTPEVEITLEKANDGYPPLLLLATNGATSADLLARAAVPCQVSVAYFPETYSSASGTPIAEVWSSGMYWSQSSFTFSVDGNFSESLSLSGSHRDWRVGVASVFSGQFDNTDRPLAKTLGSGGIQQKEHIIFNPPAGLTALDVNGQLNATKALKCTILPTAVDGISQSGLNEYTAGTQFYKSAIQSISVSCDGGREDLNELGHKTPYYKFLNIPVTISTEIEIINKSGDYFSVLENGKYNGDNSPTSTIKIACRDGLFIDLGTENKLSTVAVGGGGADGGNSTLTYSFETDNYYTVTHDQDPTTALR